MSEYNKTVLTNAGLDLMARANKGTAKFTITRAATSTEQLADKSMVDLQQLTELPGLMQYGIINDVANSSHDSSIVIGVELVFNNQDLSNGYNINTIGLFAKEDGKEKEILYAITTALTPESMPDFQNKVLFKFNVTMFVAVSRADNVAVNVTDNGVVTQEQLTHAIQQLPQKQDITNIYNKVDEIKDVIDKLSSFENPDFKIKSGDKLDLDITTDPGIYSFNNIELITSINTSAIDQVPKTDNKATGFATIMKHDDNNLDQVLLINDNKATNGLVILTRSIDPTSNVRPVFRRLLDSSDYINLSNKIEMVDKKELVHFCADLDSGVAYSKANPNVFVATP